MAWAHRLTRATSEFDSSSRKYSAYVRDGDTLSLAQFVRASSGLPADILGLGGRGYLAKGMIADVLVLDPRHYQENASFSEWDRLSSGVDHLLVNGGFAIKDGVVTQLRLGQPLRRKNLPQGGLRTIFFHNNDKAVRT